MTLFIHRLWQVQHGLGRIKGWPNNQITVRLKFLLALHPWCLGHPHTAQRAWKKLKNYILPVLFNQESTLLSPRGKCINLWNTRFQVATSSVNSVKLAFCQHYFCKILCRSRYPLQPKIAQTSQLLMTYTWEITLGSSVLQKQPWVWSSNYLWKADRLLATKVSWRTKLNCHL